MQRDTSLDIMRFLGVLIIIIAHSEPPEWLFQMRNFGTPLLIVASALTYSVIFRKRSIQIGQFYKKRMTRLIAPTWTFLTIFFISVYLVSRFLEITYPFSQRQILESYVFYAGIGYVWILKVYMILALITPLAVKFRQSVASLRVYFAILLLAYILYELALPSMQSVVPDDMQLFFNDAVFIIIPYSILFLYGFRLDQVSNRKIVLVSVISLAIFAYLAVTHYLAEGHFVQTQRYKYPPQLYYLSYALFCLNMTYLLCKKFLIRFVPVSIAVWFSTNSLWVYLWHIMAVYLLDFIIGPTNGSMWLFLIKATFVLLFGISVTIAQRFLVERFIETSNNTYIRRLAVVLS